MSNTVIINHELVGMTEEEFDWWKHEIEEIEPKIAEDWFEERTNAVGERELYLRLRITGLFPRRIGPFACKQDALLHLACFLCSLEDPLARLPEIGDDRYRVVIEDELASAYRQKGTVTHGDDQRKR
jgi:hypothetical protein